MIVFISILVLLFFFLFQTEKGHELRRFAAETIASTQHREWVKWLFLPQDELDEILAKIKNPKYSNTLLAPDLNGTDSNPNIPGGYTGFPKKTDPLIVKVETIEKRYSATSFYKGKVMTISNPFNVKLRTSELSSQGQQIFVIAKNVNAIAATNAGGFYDPNGIGNGGIPLGIIIENGKVINDSKGKENYVAALTKNGQLLTGKFTAKQLISSGVQSAAGFKPQLISNGKKMITDGDGGWGLGPRTAMGQTKDGKIILVVIDGRQVTRSIGASIREVQDILYERGAINAMAMDGGSSASMYLNGENITTPSSVGNIPRYLPNIWAVIPNKGQRVKVLYDGDTIINEQKYNK
ncbi:branched-chain amino acid ABC transporter permease [Priestia megaterium]|nr:branched-chain amino acid ABC transporter permease [Priestia megaterium]